MTTSNPILERRNALVESNLDLVGQIAKNLIKTLPPCFDLDDLVQEGRLGLMDAASKWDETRGVPFRAYARFRIDGDIRESTRRRRYKDSTHSELDPAVHDRPDNVVPIDERIQRRQVCRNVARAMDSVPEPQRTVLEIYYQREGQLKGIGRSFEVGQTRSSQLLADAHGKARRAFEIHGIRKAA